MAGAAQENSEHNEQYTYGHSKTVTRAFGQRTATSHAAFFIPYLRPGMSLLDCGCGPGSITIGFAETVAPGEVVGVDMAENQLEQARDSAQERGLSNLRFEMANVYDFPLPDDSFDAVFSHLAHNGADPFFGRRLRSLLNELGMVRVEACASYECHGAPESVQVIAESAAGYFSGSFADQVIELGWLDRPEIDRVNAAWKEWGENPDAFWARSWCEAVGWKE